MQTQLWFENLRLKEELAPQYKTVNVASIPQRSPFRYPGGKTWFIPTLRKWLRSLNKKPELFIEPFAGGGIASLTVAFENSSDQVLMVEIDEQVAAVWETIINNGEASWLIKKIKTFDLNKENLILELNKIASECKDIAFQTILKNRTYHGGILANGSGIIKHGEKGKGLLSRWYPQTLAKRIENIDLVRKKISFIREDGLSIIKKYTHHENTVFFIDPPYTIGGKCAGSRLYKYSEINHKMLFELCKNLVGNFVMTYDNVQEVIKLAEEFQFDYRSIPMKNTHHAKMTELVIGKNLSWMDVQ
ncbi:MAG: DNA adenine methylase [Candidatus Auribacterota bacterium]